MSTINDLTGYTWVGNSNITWSFMPQSSFLLSFSSNSINFDSLEYTASPDGDYLSYIFPTTNVYDFSTNQWLSDNYKTISITGGIDATNSTLIAWLEANGTLAPAGYDSTITLTNCTCNKSSETGLSGPYSATITATTGYYLSAVTCVETNSSPIVNVGTVTIATNKKSATITIPDVNCDFTITATGAPIQHINIALHPNNQGAIDYTKELHDHSKQDALISGTNIKTINNESIVGPGNVDIGYITYLTTAPSSDNTSGRLSFVILPSSEESTTTKYNGYFYIFTSSNV